MTDQSDPIQQQKPESFLEKAAVVFVRVFGSWASIFVHTLIFISWAVFKLNLEILLVIVSIEAIYFCIFILMAENIETAQRDRQQEAHRRQDMRVVRQDAAVDKKAFQELQEIHQKINDLQKLVNNIMK